MLAYYGYTISPNQIETGEGFLICRNVPIARTGDQSYLGNEIGLSGADSVRLVTVRRMPEEVFSEAALASFEGKPITNNHPPHLIGPDDVTMYGMGHAELVRRGLDEWSDYVVADLHIQARELIEAIRNGKREISCGYECEYVQNEDGTYSQKNIRGNHIAVVDRGRAGKRAAILDSDTTKNEQAKRPERKKMKKHGWLFNIFGQAVKDKSPEEIEQMAMDAAAAFDEEGEGEKKDKGSPAPEETEDAAMIDAIAEKVIEKMAAKEAEKKEEEKGKAEDSIDAAISRLTGQDAAETSGSGEDTERASRVIPAKETDRACGMDKALAASILKAMRPSVAAIKDEAQRKEVSDALIRCVTVQDNVNNIAAIMQATQKNAQAAADSASRMDLEAIQKAYDSQNPHRKENK